MLETPVFRKILSLDKFKQILKYLHFSDNSNAPSKTEESYDRLWKIRNIFDILVKNFKNAYNPAQNCVVDEIIVTFKGRVIFRQYIPKKHKRWGIKIYKLCDETAYTCDMKVYLGKDKAESYEGKSAPESVVINLIQDLKGKGHNLFIDNFFTSPSLLLYLRDECLINCCGTVRKNRKNMPKDLIAKIVAMWLHHIQMDCVLSHGKIKGMFLCSHRSMILQNLQMRRKKNRKKKA